MEKFVVYGPGRTGTTTLLRLIRHHPDVNPDRIAGELWTENEKHGDFHLVKNLEEFKEFFVRSYQLFDGYKVLVGHLNQHMREYLLSSDLCARVIRTSRRNVLKGAVSRMVAHQTERWNKYQIAARPITEPIKIDDVIQGMKVQMRSGVEESILDDKKVLNVVYEDFYLSPFEIKLEKLKSIFEFIGLSPIITDDMIENLEMGAILNQRDYLKIPNVYEIEKTLGSDETGWLFDGYGGLI